jgi:hypothetical protein
MSGFKTSEMSGLQNVSFTKRQVYKTSGCQSVRSSKRQCNANEFFYRESLAAGSLDQLPAPLEHILADA